MIRKAAILMIVVSFCMIGFFARAEEETIPLPKPSERIHPDIIYDSADKAYYAVNLDLSLEGSKWEIISNCGKKVERTRHTVEVDTFDMVPQAFVTNGKLKLRAGKVSKTDYDAILISARRIDGAEEWFVEPYYIPIEAEPGTPAEPSKSPSKRGMKLFGW